MIMSKMGEINGVKIKKLVTHLTEDGYFREIVRDEERVLKRFGQSSVSLTFPGSIKAFHYHKKQDDLWHIFCGQVRAVLFDMRKGSPTYGVTQVVMMGEDAPSSLFIPKGVAHGYQVLGNKEAILFYHTTEHYNPKDEFRISYDSPDIAFDWSIKHE